MVMVSTISDNHLQNTVRVMYSGEIDGVDSSMYLFLSNSKY